MGGLDKGWVEWQGRPLVEQVMARLQPQVDAVLVSANRSLGRYRALGCEVVEDDPAMGGAFAGPLAGMICVLRATRASHVAFVPCDAPAFPGDLVARLRSAARTPGRAAVASCGGRWQSVFCLLPVELGPALEALFRAGERRPETALRTLGAKVAQFDSVEAFANVNEPPGEGGR